MTLPLPKKKLTLVLVHLLTEIYFANSTLPLDNSLVNKVLDAYPDIPSQGSPYQPVGVSADDRFFGSINQYKRAASIYGDIRYQSNRRLFLSALATNNVKAYSYLYAQTRLGDVASVGVPHGADLNGGSICAYCSDCLA